MPETATSKRTYLLNGIAAAIPILFFVCLELGLRLTGYGAPIPLFIAMDGAPTYQTQNPDVARRYFKTLENLPTSPGDVFLARKPAAGLRLVVQGGSSAAGYPYYYGGSFSRMLQQRLDLAMPERHIEVINTSMAAVNSFTLLDFSEEILAIQPDAILIYAGHNEYYGAFGVGSAESAGSGVLARAMLRLSGFRTIGLISNLLRGGASLVAGDGTGSPNQTLMQQMAEDQSIELHSEAYERGLIQFRNNLSTLLETYESAGVPVFIATLSSNEKDQAPFITAHSPDDSWNDDFETFKSNLVTLSVTEAIQRVSSLIEQFDGSAQAYFLRGKLHLLNENPIAAKSDFKSARDRDLLRFRAPTAMNEIIEEVAAEHRATVVPVLNHFEQVSPDGIVGSELMLEHLHPNIDGYFEMQNSFFKELVQNGVTTDGALPRIEVAVTEVDSVFASLRLKQLMNSWPFRTDADGAQSTPRFSPTDKIDSLGLAVFQESMTWYEAQTELRQELQRQGDIRGALRAARALQMHLPYNPETNVRLALALAQNDRKQEAARYFEATNVIEETVEVYLYQGSNYVDLGDNKKAETSFRRAYELNSTHEGAAIRLAAILVATGRRSEALEFLVLHASENPNHQRVPIIIQQIETMPGG